MLFVATCSNGALALSDPTQAKNSTNSVMSILGPATSSQSSGAISGAVGSAVGGAGSNSPTGQTTVRFGLSGQAAAAGGPKWNGWVAYSQSKVGYTPVGASGTVDVAVAGIDYLISNMVVAGVAVAGDRSRVNTAFNAGSISGNGYTISPYFGIALNREFTVDGTIGFGRGNVDLNAGGAGTGSFKDRRTISSVGLTYRKQSSGPWLISGRGALLNTSSKLGAYTLSGGGSVQDTTVNVTQLRLSGQLGYRAGIFTPYVGLTYIYDIHRPTDPGVPGQPAPSNDRDGWAPSIGLRFNSAGALYGGIQYTSEQNRSQVKNNQLLMNLGIRF